MTTVITARAVLVAMLVAGFSCPLSAQTAQTLPGEGNACLPSLGNGNICTAKDLRLSAELISGPSACQEGELITLAARVLIGPGENASRAAAERYSVAFFVGENGVDAIDPPSGSCTVSFLTPNTGSVDLASGQGPYKELSPTPDSCGDIASVDDTYHDVISTQVLCRDSDGDGRLDVSAAATWENNKTDNCSNPPVVSDFYPDQSSKCLYDPNLDFDISVDPVERAPTIHVTKEAIPRLLREPGGEVSYEITVENTSGQTDPVTIDTLTDDRFGNLDGQGSCATPIEIAPGTSYSCQFQQSLVGASGDAHINVVTAGGQDDEGTLVSGSDNARVVFLPGSITPPPSPSMSVTKTGSFSSLPEPGGKVEYTVVVTNTGDDALTLTGLDDDQVGGSLDGRGNCSLPLPIPVGGAASCGYELTVTGNPGDAITNTVTATASPATASGGSLVVSDDFTVDIFDVPSNLRVVKTALQQEVTHPGATTKNLDYRVELINLSSTDAITITSMTDVQQEGANPASAAVEITTLPTTAGKNACSLPQTLTNGGAGRTYTCYFTRSFNGANLTVTSPPSGTTDVVSDTVTAVGTDDDGDTVSASDGAQVLVVASPVGSIAVIKTPSPNVIDSAPANVAYTVEVINTGEVGSDPVTLTSLTDSVEGGSPIDITDTNNVVSTDCVLPQTIALGSIYICTFTQSVDGDPGEGISNIIRAAGTDNSGNDVLANAEATVSILPPPLDIDVVKTASLRTVQPNQQVTFSVSVTNSSGVNLFLSELTDSVYGDLNGKGTCMSAVPLVVGGTYTCEFTEPVSNSFGPLHVNTVTATAIKLTKALLPGSTVSDSDRAFVLVLPLVPTAAVAVPVGGGLVLLGLIAGLLVVVRRFQI